MREALATTLWIVLFVASDAIRLAIQHIFHQRYLDSLGSPNWLNSGHNLLFVDVIIYVLVFALTGAIVALWSKRPRTAALSALALGASVPGLGLIFGPPTAMHYEDNMSVWLEATTWANFYVPPLACCAGAALWCYLRTSKNAA